MVMRITVLFDPVVVLLSGLLAEPFLHLLVADMFDDVSVQELRVVMEIRGYYIRVQI